MKYDVREATGEDWVWVTRAVRDTGNPPEPQDIIARMVPALTVEQALALPAATFREVFAACSASIAGDDDESD
jgi:hypothetical protein